MIAVLLILFFAQTQFSVAQLQTNCENSNFEYGDFSRWEGCYGIFGNNGNTLEPCEYPGYHPQRHVIIPAPGTYDPNTCDSLITVYPGEQYSARLGDTQNGGHAEQLKYTLDVTSDSYLFIYRYAVVLEDPSHQPQQQPAFKIEIQGPEGTVLDSTCGYYYVYAEPGLPGWHACGNVYWKDWTTVGMDMTPYVGQTVKVVFTTRGCCFSAHFGYAYINTYCSKLNLDVALCEGDTNAVLTAPPGFYYEWSTINGDPSINGDTTASITIGQPVTGDEYFCKLTSYNGCEVTISQTLSYTVIHAGFETVDQCAGLPTNFYDTSTVTQNNVVDWKWDFGDGTPILEGEQNPQHTYAVPDTFDVTLIAYSTEGCSDTTTVSIIVDSLPNVNNDTLRKAVCSRNGIDIPLTGEVSNTLFTWTASASSANITGFFNNSVPQSYLNDTLINTGAVIDSVMYTITPHNSDCDGFDTLYTVLVYPLPVLSNTTLVKSICDSTSTNIDLESNNDTTRFTWTCTASSVNVSGYLENTTTPDTLINQILRNTGYDIDTVYYHILPQSYGCFGDTIIYKVAVYPVPDLSNSPTQSAVCSGQSAVVNLTSHVSGTLFTWTAYRSSANVTGYSNSSVPGTTINQTLTNSGTGIDTVTYRLMPSANSCFGDSTDYRVVVFPTPDLSNTAVVEAQCNNVQTNIILTSNVDSTLFTWRAFATSGNLSGYNSNTGPSDTLITQTLVNSGYTIDTVYYRLVPHANGCAGDSVDYKVAVYPTPDLSNSPVIQTQCNNQLTGIALTSNVANTTFTWKAYTTSANITGFSDNTGPGAITIDQTLVNSGYNIDTVTYRLLPVANNCIGDSIDYQVIVNPIPDLSNTTTVEAQCNNLETNITLTSNIANTLFTWRAFATTGNITGFSSNTGPGTTTINHTLVNSGYTVDTVYYRILPTANSCAGDSIDLKVAVYPTPDLSNTPLIKQICNENFTNINLTSNVPGTLFTWTITPGAGNITGYSENTGSPTTILDQQLFLNGVISDSIFYHIAPHANGCDGPIYDYEVKVNPFPMVTNHPMYDTICDLNSPLLDLEATCDGSTFVWIAQLGFGNVTGQANGAGPLIDQTLDNHITTPGEVQYIVTPTAYGCPGPDTTFYILINPTAQLTNPSLVDTICSGETTGIALTSNVSPVAFIWTCEASSPNLLGFSDNLIPTDSIKQTVTNTGYTIETVTYHVTPVTDGCNGDTTDFILQVNPIPDVSNTPLFSELCNGTSTNIALLSNVVGANFSWAATPSSANIIGWGPGSGLLIDQVLTNTGFVLENVTYHITPTANGCVGPTTDYVATVVSLPDVYFDPSAQTICSEDTSNIQVLSNVTSATFTWTALESSPNLSGFSNGSGPLIKQPITNSGNTIETVTYTATPEAFGCPSGIPQSVILTVNPTPHVTTTPLSQSICTETATNTPLTSTVAGSTYDWTAAASSGTLSGFSDGSGDLIAQTIANSGFTTETVTYTITPTANSCQGPDSIYTVTIFPRPDMANNPPSLAVCSGQSTGVNLISNVSGTLFTWTATGSSLFVSGFSNNATPTIILDQTLTNSGYDIETVTYTVTPAANGCDGTDTIFIVSLFPVPDIANNPLAKEICNNNNTDVDLTSNIAGTLFTWTATGSSVNITGFTDNTTPSTYIGDNLINTGDVNETVTYHIIPHANGCDGIMVDYTVTVVPSPYLTNSPLVDTRCNGQSTGLSLLSNVAGTQFSWTCTPSSGNISGYSNSTIPGTLIDQTLVNSGFDTESVTYHITPENSGCPGSVTDYTFTLYPVPDVYFVPNGETICEGQVTNLSILSHVTGTTYTWTANPSSPNLAGYSDGSGNLIAQTIDNNGSTIEFVTYQVTPAANGCAPGTTMPVVATVNPLPVITNATTRYQICNSTLTGIGLQADVSGSTFAWRAFSSSPNITGFNDGSGFIIAQTLLNGGYEIDSVTYRVAASANGCTGDSTDFIVVVFPVADVIFTPPSQALCSGETTAFTITSNVAGTSFTWTATGSSGAVSGYSGGSGTLIQQTLTNSGYLIPTVTYLVTPVANGCTGTQNNVVVAVNPWPVVTLSVCYDTLLTTESTPFTLKAGNPPGGTYAGTGVNTGRFYPALADTGRHTITYYYVNTYGCDAIDSIHITVAEPTPFVCGDTVTDIRDNRTYPTVQLGTQCWMTANLNYGNVIVSSLDQRDNCIPEKYCVNDNPAKCTQYGGLYQWTEIMRYTTDNSAQGFCPPGWHLPTETEWNTLFNQYISNGFAGNALKPSGYSGFNALLEGMLFHYNKWKFRATDTPLNSTMFWSSSQHGPNKAWAHGMNEVVINVDYTPSVSFYPSQQINAFSARCLKD
ncbi:MAG: PKD domain-containing protein [Bacteroidales bacterium]|nr:PKD domain-containing protein [Bacteroidales bacterium]